MNKKAIVHYSELALKGQNRPFFEKKLIENIKKSCSNNKIVLNSIRLDNKRIICEFSTTKTDVIEKTLSMIPGIRYLAIVSSARRDEKSILQEVQKILLRQKEKGSVASIARRSDKKFKPTSSELNRKIGDLARELGFTIDLKNPDLKIYTEVTQKAAYLYTGKVTGIGGLPVSTGGKMLCLFSGGIDSAVAAFLMMKRGCKVDFLHFHALRKNEDVLKTKIGKIIGKLNEFQYSCKLYSVPYHSYQFSASKIPDNMDLVVFRNFMLRVSQELIHRKYKGIITGDSFGQVASQTADNLLAASYSINIPIYRPLISYDKEESVDLAKKIGTFSLSLEKYKDCCSIISRKPLTSVKLSQIKSALSDIDLDKIIRTTLSEMSVFKIN